MIYSPVLFYHLSNFGVFVHYQINRFFNNKDFGCWLGEQYISCIELENRFPVYIRQQKAIPSVMISCMNTFGENRLLVYIRLQNAISSVIISCMNTFGEKIQYFFLLLIVFSSIEFIELKYRMLPTCVSMGMIGSSNIESLEGELFSSASKYCRYRAFIKIIMIRF